MVWRSSIYWANHACTRGSKTRKIFYKRQNYIYQRGSEWHVHIGEHKTSKSSGAIDFAVDAEVQKGLEQFLPYVRAKTKHGYLLSNKKGGKMSKQVKNKTVTK